jgi:hypothetical protein
MMEYWINGILGLARMECVMNANISSEIYCKMDNFHEEPSFHNQGKNLGLKKVIYLKRVEEISRPIRLLREPMA